MLDDKPVRACMCYSRTFGEIKTIAGDRGWTTVEEITRELGCGSGCGLCRPYLAKMLETGNIAFSVIESTSRCVKSRKE